MAKNVLSNRLTQGASLGCYNGSIISLIHAEALKSFKIRAFSFIGPTINRPLCDHFLHKKVSLSNHKLLAETFRWGPGDPKLDPIPAENGSIINFSAPSFEIVEKKVWLKPIRQELARHLTTVDHLFYSVPDYADPQ